MAERYMMFNKIDGFCVNRNLPVNTGTDRMEIAIADGGPGELEIPWAKLSTEVQNDWSRHFEPMSRWIGMVDDEAPASDETAFRAVGFISKISKPTGSGHIYLTLAPVEEYLAARIYCNVGTTPMEEPERQEGEEEPTLKAANASEMIRHIVWKCFNEHPAGTRTPPQVLRNGGVSATTGTAFTIPEPQLDSTNYHAMIADIRDNLSLNGIEWQFVGRWRDEARQYMCLDLLVGSDAVPHIREDITYTVELSENSNTKTSEFSTAHDSTAYYNRAIVKYAKPAPTTDDAEATKAAVRSLFAEPYNPRIPLVDGFVTADEAAYSESHIDGVLRNALQDALWGGSEVSFTVEEQWDRSVWAGRLGAKVEFVGVNNTISGGDSITVRCTAIEMSVQRGSIKVTFEPLRTRNKKAPSARKKDKALNPAKYVTVGDVEQLVTDWGKTFDPWGGSTPPSDGGTPPTDTAPTDPYAGVDGVSNPNDLAGSEGKNPWETVKQLNNPMLTDLKVSVRTFETWDGITAVSARSLCQTDTNRLFGVDHDQEGWGVVVGSNGTATQQLNGGLDPATGARLGTWRDIFIKKTSLAPDGTLGPLETVGKISGEQLKSCFPSEWEIPAAYAGRQWDGVQGYHVTNWWVAGRLYIGIAAYMYSTTNRDVHRQPNEYNSTHYPYFMNNKITIFSIAIDTATGKPSGEWRTEDWNFDHDYLPHPWNISRYGNRVIFGYGYPCMQLKLNNETFHQVVSKYGYHFNPQYGSEYSTNYGPDQAGRNGHWLMKVGAGRPQVINLETGSLPINQEPFSGAYTKLANTPTPLWKDFSDPNSKLNHFDGYNPNKVVTHTLHKFIDPVYQPIISHESMVYYDWNIGVPIGIYAGPNGIGVSAPSPKWSDGNIGTGGGTLLTVVGGVFVHFVQGDSRYGQPSIATFFKYNPQEMTFTKIGEQQGPSTHLFTEKREMAPFDYMRMWYAITKQHGVTPEPYEREITYHSRLFSYGGRLYAIHNGSNTGKQSLTTRSVKAAEQV